MKPDVNFETLLTEAGLPNTQRAITDELEKAVSLAGSQIANDRDMSPWWKLVKAVVVKPALWLVNGLMAGHVLPAMFVATAKGVYLDLKAWEVDLERQAATFAQGVLVFQKTDPLIDTTVPAGVLIDTQPIDGQVFRVQTVSTVVIPAGAKEGAVPVIATEAGQGHNLPAGYFNRLAAPLDGIASVANAPDWLIDHGSDTEDDEALALRVRNRYAAAGQYHIDAVYRDMLAAAGNIRVDHMVFEHDAPRGPGTANCHIFMEVGSVPAALLTRMNDHINAGYHGHGDDVRVMALPTTRHALNGRFWPHPSAEESTRATLKNALTERINAAFRNNDEHQSMTRVWPQSRFSMSQMVSELHKSLPALGGIEFDEDDIISGLDLPTLNNLTLIEVPYGAR